MFQKFLPYFTAMVTLAAFVESYYYVLLVSVVICIAIFWFTLAHNRKLLLPFIVSAVFVLGLSFAIGLFKVFLISVPSGMVGLTLHLWIAASLAHFVLNKWSYRQ